MVRRILPMIFIKNINKNFEYSPCFAKVRENHYIFYSIYRFYTREKILMSFYAYAFMRRKTPKAN